MTRDILLIAVGLILLIAGAELLVRSSVLIAARLGVSSLLIGLTVVAFGTSAPEIVASVVAALRGSSGIAVGNIVGSNITNALLVTGSVALVAPIAVTGAALRRDGVMALVSAAALWFVCAMQKLEIFAGVVLLSTLVLYVWFAYRQERINAAPGAIKSRGMVHAKPEGAPVPTRPHNVAVLILGAVAGLALLAGGGQLLVVSAVNLAVDLGISEAVIGLTIVAIGTSLPELATSLLAARRGESGIAFGNVLGSNIFNVLGIGGLTAILSQGDVPTRIIVLDFPTMLAATGLLLIVAATGRRIGKVEGGVLVVLFCAYLASMWV
jgi:cation:H+ antiporter